MTTTIIGKIECDMLRDILPSGPTPPKRVRRRLEQLRGSKKHTTNKGCWSFNGKWDTF